jgi:tetraacyldisaccharide 4'-kinase
MFRLLLLPFSFLYGMVLYIRHQLYDSGILKSVSFQFPVITVGNLELGGTGKTPHTLQLTHILKPFHPAILSRGYKRKSKGFLELPKNADPAMYGDEPVLFRKAFPEIPVAVCEKRPEGIRQIKENHPETGVVILDDAFQHRRLKPGFSVLLIDWQTLQKKTFLLPAGRLRDLWGRRHKANVMVLSKCPSEPNEKQKETLINKLKPNSNQTVYFSWYAYTGLTALDGTSLPLDTLKNKPLVLVCGIADPSGLIQWLEQVTNQSQQQIFPDHYAYSESDIHNIQQKFGKFASYYIITEKDRVKLQQFIPQENQAQWLSLQIAVQIDRPTDFENEIKNYVATNSGDR